MKENSTLRTLMSPWFESAFFASFLCRFGQRNDAPPRAVANSDKENSKLKQTPKAESTNPARPPTATARTQPAPQPLTQTQTPPPRPPARATLLGYISLHR